MTEQYEWVTDAMFDRALTSILDNMTGQQILAVPGAYEVLSEDLNNAVLDRLTDEREAEA